MGDENVNIRMFNIKDITPKFVKSNVIKDANKNCCFCRIKDHENSNSYYKVLKLTSDNLFEGFNSDFKSDDERFEVVTWGRLPQG